ncbi:hypothetical protein BC835DRAFT_1413207 [Cytidiella melzeri]|nr:hypothetical protein BC835DRAFT_1413207 [Cytidiella melzeri]
MVSDDPTSSVANDDDQHLRSGRNLIPALLDKLPVPELRTLIELREKGWSNAEFDKLFASQRAAATAPDEKAKRAWFTLMKKAFGELNDYASFVPSSGPYSFLDVGCCPGSFTSYILSLNPDARGMGISLPLEQGGHEYTLEHWLRRRFRLQWADLTYYQLHPSAQELRGKTLIPFPTRYSNVDLVILDGHYLRELYLTPQLAQPTNWDSYRLMISQMIIGLKAVRDGNTIVMKLSHVEWTRTAQTLFILDVLSTSLRTYKPRIIHANRGSFYAIAEGVGHGPRGKLKAQYIQQYEKLWLDIACGGEEGKGRGPEKDDLDFVVTFEEVEDGYLERLAELGMDPWIVQASALRRMLKQQGSL